MMKKHPPALLRQLLPSLIQLPLGRMELLHGRPMPVLLGLEARDLLRDVHAVQLRLLSLKGDR